VLSVVAALGPAWSRQGARPHEGHAAVGTQDGHEDKDGDGQVNHECQPHPAPGVILPAGARAHDTPLQRPACRKKPCAEILKGQSRRLILHAIVAAALTFHNLCQRAHTHGPQASLAARAGGATEGCDMARTGKRGL
jgi:hypothetical protein